MRGGGDFVLAQRVVLGGTLAAALVLLAGCSAGDSRAGEAAKAHSVNAGTAMLKPNVDEPAPYAAYRVVGTGADDTIEAVRADGTTWHGEIILRISVDIEGSGFERDSRAVRCYRYTLRHTLDDYTPHRVRPCPSGTLTLSPPPPVGTLPSGSAGGA